MALHIYIVYSVQFLALCAVVFPMRLISVSAHITLCARVFIARLIDISPYHTLCTGCHCETYLYQPISHYVHRFSLRDLSISAHITLCAHIFTVRRISVSAHITLCAQVFSVRRITVSAYITQVLHCET